jgi:hypothetical protein
MILRDRTHPTFSAALRRGLPIGLGIVAAWGLIDAPLAQAPPVSTKQLMETTITDASNAIWNAYDPPSSDAQWVALEKAALELIDATKLNAIGGTGPMDKEWASQPAWKPFNDAMLQASEAALKAIRAKDHNALLMAGDQLYPPCEGCHMLFNPGVVNQK